MSNTLPTLVWGGTRLRSDGVHRVDLDVLLESRLLVQANSGAGKSHLLRNLLESTASRLQHIVIDREGEFSTLRERYPYLLVGPGGELAVDQRTAPLLARKLLELGTSAVIDLSDTPLERQRDYVAAFLNAISALPRELWRQCLVVIDEAHLFAPQRSRTGTTTQSLDAIALAASIWRKRGYCLALATQRIAKLDKDVSEEMLNKLIGRTSEADRKRAAEELGISDAASRELRAFTPGMFWAYGPAIAIEPVKVRSGPILTHPPKRGAGASAAPATPAAIAEIASALADLPAQAAEEASSIDALERQVQDLKRELRQAKSTAPKPDPTETARMVGQYVRRNIKVVETRLRADIRKLVKDTAATLDQLAQDAITAALADSERVHSPLGVVAPVDLPLAKPRAIAPTAARHTTRTPFQDRLDVKLRKGEREMVNVLARVKRPLTRTQLATMTGYAESGGTFGTYLSTVLKEGLIESTADGRLTVTEHGLAYAGPALADHPPPDVDEILNLWRGRFRAGERKMLDILVAAYPRTVSREELADQSGYAQSGGTFGTYVGTLRSNGLAIANGNGVQLNPDLFLED